jgi:hypothetical protein
MHEMTRHYLVCALWSSTGDNDEPLDAEHDITDIEPESVANADTDCLAFLAKHGDDIGTRYEQAGHDFWLTRNGHGAGFWEESDWPKEAGQRMTATCEQFGEADIYKGDDGLLYISTYTRKERAS